AVVIGKFKAGRFQIQDNIMAETGGTDYLVRIGFSRDGNTMVASGISTLWVWDAKTGKLKKSWTAALGIFTFSLSPDGQTIATPGGKSGDIILWDTQTGANKQTLKVEGGGEKRSGRPVFSPDGKTLASATDKDIKLWDISTGQVRQTLSGHTGDVLELNYSPDGTILASSSKDKTIKLWDAQTGALKHTLIGHAAERIPVLAFSPDGSTLASCADDKTAKLWDVETGTLVQTITEHGADVNALDFSLDGKRLVTSATNGTMKFWAPQ
ncbi:MAG: WD40 repeat domain-containing protein, partial [Acidobacteria bacterium]|nr:WD40 repeat domain-containing protein [Acidobacteriota bacterium]